jgi:transposase InsO family protein
LASHDPDLRELKLLVDHREDLVASWSRSAAPSASPARRPSPATRDAIRSRFPLGGFDATVSRLGNRKLNAALHQVVLTQARVHPPARAYLAKKRAEGKSNKEAFRCLNGTWCGSSSGL